MSIIRNKIKLLILLCILLFASIIFFNVINNKIYAEENDTYEYVNDLSGDYTIESLKGSTANERKGLSIGLGFGYDCVSDTGEEAPKLYIDDIDDVSYAYQRFTFIPTSINDGKMKYEITSCLDNNGRLCVLNNKFNNHNEIRFYDVINSEDTDVYLRSREWYVLTKDGGKSFVIMNAISDSMVMESYNLDGLDTCCIISLNETDSVLWNIVPVAGQIGLATKTYIMNDDIGYDITQGEEVSRFVEPTTRDNKLYSVGTLSKVLSVGVHGENIRKTTYEEMTAIAVNYNSNFYIDTSFIFANNHEIWQEGKQFGLYKDVSATLSYDAYCFENKKANKVGLGLYILETSYDNINWEKEYVSFDSELYSDVWTISGEKVAKGVYVRLSFVYEMKYKKYNNDNWTNNRETTGTFFVCVDGFSQAESDEDTLSPVTVHNLSTKNNNINEIVGYDIEQIMKCETLINNSVTSTGFKINSLFASYKIEISINNRDYIEVKDGYTQNNAGKYNIRVTTKFGTTKSMLIYVLNDNNNLEKYFDTPFSNTLDDYSFIQGKRVLSGKNEYLEEHNIHLNYNYSDVPVYQSGAKIFIERSSTLPNLKGIIRCTNNNGVEEYDFNYVGDRYSKTLTKPGKYTATLEVGIEFGDKITYIINWLIVEDDTSPYINEQLINNNSHETYDLIPVYYAVNVTGDRYTFKDENGNFIEKTQVISYAFADYDTALSFALRYEKEFVTYSDSQDSELYPYQYFDRYSGKNNNYGEYMLYRKMLENAKKNVVKSYFSNTKSITMQIFTPYDENGKVRKYDDGITETVAYCLEMNTNHCIVTTDKIELAKLTARQPYINNYKFISIPQDSFEVILTDENNKAYDIEYNVNVEEQLSSKDAKTGKYIVTEENIYGDVSTYEVYYIAKNKICNTELLIFESDRNKTYNYIDADKKINIYDSFKLLSASNIYDNHSLIIVSKDDEEILITDTSKLSEGIEFNEPGTYNIFVEDRMGNNYEFKIIINEPLKVATTI